ncbi:hypothetical protein CERZMDRAFT_101312 [Cercospora zeae-maydis SCOH1-5]|uniref:Uncharacterized protein n=1 Tax=Cercospora zeae-maydis SCOH1-5 TaxID=717836 RepID=A0A6A6F480_9PEZI|nr:hypothetical protein CERZMDRAFT_101312 [Cercospora zeae-maydis SCOH1-5]
MSLREENGEASAGEVMQRRSADAGGEAGREGREELPGVELMADPSSVGSAPLATISIQDHDSSNDQDVVDRAAGHQEEQEQSQQVTGEPATSDSPTPAIQLSEHDAFITQTTDFEVPALREPPPAYRYRARADEIVGFPPAYQLPPVYQREEVRASGSATRRLTAVLDNSRLNPEAPIPVHHDATANRSFPFPATRVRSHSLESDRTLLPAFFDGHDYDSFGDEESLESESSVEGENLATRRKAFTWSRLVSSLTSLRSTLRYLASELRSMDQESRNVAVSTAMVAVTIVVGLILALLVFWGKLDFSSLPWRYT